MWWCSPGRAEVVKDAPLPSGLPGFLGKYQETITAMGYTQEWYDEYHVAIHVTPDRSWALNG